MPSTPQRPCRYPGCPALCEKGQVYCREHMAWSGEKLRGNRHERGYNSKWVVAREQYLRRHPLCAVCRREGKLTAATVVDHIIPHRGDKVLFWDQSNWEPLCKSCHDKKTGHGL